MRKLNQSQTEVKYTPFPDTERAIFIPYFRLRVVKNILC